MQRSRIICTFLLVTATLFGVSGQDDRGLSTGEQFYQDRAFTDAKYEHQLQFARTADEIDFWNDQRTFEQQLFQKHPARYRTYLKAKRISYMKHQGVCKGSCGHGDYYLRQASFYLQYNATEESDFLTLIQLKGDRGWEVSYSAGSHR